MASVRSGRSASSVASLSAAEGFGHSSSLPDLPSLTPNRPSRSCSEAFSSSTRATDEDELSVPVLREARKRAELNAQTLCNRIALLRSEGERAIRQIEQTRLRTQELENKPLKAQESVIHLHNRLEDIRAQQRKNQLLRESRRSSAEAVRNALFEGRRKNAQQVKDTSRELQANKKLRDDERMRVIMERAVALRERGTGKVKQRMLEEARMAQFAKNREERRGRGTVEIALRTQAERHISEMEREEEELMEWLQAKQVEQREAYDELAMVVASRQHRSQIASFEQSSRFDE